MTLPTSDADIAAAEASAEALAASAGALGTLLASLPDRLHAAFEVADDDRATFFKMACTSLRLRLDKLAVDLVRDLADLAHACRRPKARPRPGRAQGEGSTSPSAVSR